MNHSWSILAQKFGAARYRCKACHCIKTVTTQPKPLTKYELSGKTFLKAPVCALITK